MMEKEVLLSLWLVMSVVSFRWLKKKKKKRLTFIIGHKFAGNVICYINKGKTGIWYGRVKSCHCREIIEETLLKGKVIKELYRGSMNHSFNYSSCKRIQW